MSAPGERYDSGEEPSTLSDKKLPAPSSDEGERNASGEKLTMQEPTALHKEERNDSGETNVQEPKVLLNKNFSERYNDFKRLHPAPQKPGDMWLLDYAIMNQTTEGREQETVALAIMDAHSSLMRVIPCKNRGNVLPHILDTIAFWGHTPKSIKADNAQEFVNEKKFMAWRQANGVSLVKVQAYKHRMRAKIENFMRHLKVK